MKLACQPINKISRCSSPIPAIIVWPVSSSIRTRNVGSSWDNLIQGEAKLITISFGFRLDSHGDYWLGKCHRFKNDRKSVVAERSPVNVCLDRLTAPISPARISSISSRLFACIRTRRPMRSRLPFEELYTNEPASKTTRVYPDKDQLPDIGIYHDFKGQARQESHHRRRGGTTSAPYFGSCAGDWWHIKRRREDSQQYHLSNAARPCCGKPRHKRQGLSDC